MRDLFSLFNLEKSFFIDLNKLNINYISLQKKIAQNEKSEKEIALINESYQILKENYSRAHYLISFFPIDKNHNLQSEQLEEFLETQDEINNENDLKKLTNLKENLQKKQYDLMKKMENNLFIMKNWKKTGETFANFKFLDRLILNLNKKINKIEES